MNFGLYIGNNKDRLNNVLKKLKEETTIIIIYEGGYVCMKNNYGILKVRIYVDDIFLPKYENILFVKDGYILYKYDDKLVEEDVINKFKEDPYSLYMDMLAEEFYYKNGFQPSEEEIRNFWG